MKVTVLIMSFSWLSIQGFYKYDDSIFDGLNVPDGLNKDDVVNNILLECAELELIYIDYDIMKLAIETWSNSNQLTWSKLYHTMTVEYNPIWNVDANIEDKENTIGIKGINRSGTETPNLKDTKSVQGFNSNSWAESEKVEHTGNSKVIEDINEDSDTERTYTQKRTGNIGVTTTQQMLEQERNIAEFNMIEYITNSFKKRFCLMVY